MTSKNDNRFNTINILPSKELCHVLTRLVVGDASYRSFVREKHGIQHQFDFGSIDKEFTEKTRKALLTIFPKKEYITIFTIEPGKNTDGYKRQKYHSIRISSTRFAEYFNNLKIVEFKELFKMCPDEFLQTWFDCDGSIIFKKRKRGNKYSGYTIALMIGSTKKEWLEFAQDLLNDMNLDFRIQFSQITKGKKELYKLRTDKKKNVLSFIKNIGFFIHRKKAVENEILSALNGGI